MNETQINDIIEDMKKNGWNLYLNDDKNLDFMHHASLSENYEWIRSYDKKTCRFFQFNAKQKVNLVSSEYDIENQVS